MAREALPNALIGATLNQYGRDEAAVLRNLLPKLRAGASYVQTQPAFDAAAIERYNRKSRFAFWSVIQKLMPSPEKRATHFVSALFSDLPSYRSWPAHSR